ncbi:MAG: hypothetical protein UX12_C0006G0011 [Candidatus Collierbacteria bacterium GW2011_GWC1_45_47]|uniref:SpaA-like prealbumin fold domain-containing protein n=6 Tax=Candidatus Collieribacteriota TaxID=1752725 RepID=A0A0G1HIJ9_9BACT|nr:MAG: hypothetical protein UW23_C0009G0033 [Candidatus Collierbacteria bacterium GW2011_GWA1_44_12]KKT38810.1 MAG: hypothetical protein UW26_C0012G0025 [Candidatus Collierbacteria bacterium GW2011_GWF1_44_12]KKT46423.1 MAG: hypothetical protein UW35_C0014G0006 [Candidatus Collierbacteria bacterium GW2011_GWF2_44_15]KKT68211.1 MAG: hypothetical protein UW62_C0002G0010 [Candidatus Collierbacteria bacterium GW2011_GWB1_44_35]KKU00432.1 MAG: hypothetical protein UW99_C0001G0041 [Candidatus Collie
MSVRSISVRFLFLSRIVTSLAFLFLLLLFKGSSPAYADFLYVVTGSINDNGGIHNPTDFTVHVKSGDADVAGSPAPGARGPGTLYTLPTGTYKVSIDSISSYATNFGGDCDSGGNVTLSPSAGKTCIITNNDRAPRLNVVTSVINDGGGNAVASDFVIHVRSENVDVAGSPAPGAGSPGVLYEVSPGSYTVSSETKPSYTQSFSGDCDASGNMTISLADQKTCNVVNTFNGGVPGFPETGNVLNDFRLCLDSGSLPWIITGLSLVFAIYILVKKQGQVGEKHEDNDL